MPKQTFFNLPPQKQQVIEQAALDEFARYGYDASSMNRIVEQCQIAKGSFYQYFQDKKDLYFHLIDTLYKKKMQHVQPVLDSYRAHSFSHNIEKLLRSGLEFAMGDPQLHSLAEDFATRNQAFVTEFFQHYSPEASNIYTAMLEHALENDELRDGVNLPLTSLFISALINQTTVLLMGRYEPLQPDDLAIGEVLSFIEHAICK